MLLKLLLRVYLDLWVSIFSWFGLLLLIVIEPVYVVKEVKFKIGGDDALVKQDRDVSCLARQDKGRLSVRSSPFSNLLFFAALALLPLIVYKNYVPHR